MYSIARPLPGISWIATIFIVFCTDSVHKSKVVHRFLWKTCINRWISVRLTEKGVSMCRHSAFPHHQPEYRTPAQKHADVREVVHIRVKHTEPDC